MKNKNNYVLSERKITVVNKDKIKSRWLSFKKTNQSIPKTFRQSYRSSNEYIKKKNEICKRNLSIKRDQYYTKDSYNKIYIAIDMIIAS